MADVGLSDMVNHPAHYTSGEIECIDAMQSTAEGASVDAFAGYLWLNAFKYIFRWPHKNGIEDVKKAIWYLNKLVDYQERCD